MITSGAGEVEEGAGVDFDRLGNSRINGPSVVLAHIAEDKSYVSMELLSHCIMLTAP